MFGNNCWGNNGCLWILIIIVLLCCCGGNFGCGGC